MTATYRPDPAGDCTQCGRHGTATHPGGVCLPTTGRHIGTVTATVAFEIVETADGTVELVWKVSDYARRQVDTGRTDDAGAAVAGVRESLAGRLDRLIEGVDDAEILRDELGRSAG